MDSCLFLATATTDPTRELAQNFDVIVSENLVNKTKMLLASGNPQDPKFLASKKKMEAQVLQCICGE